LDILERDLANARIELLDLNNAHEKLKSEYESKSKENKILSKR